MRLSPRRPTTTSNRSDDDFERLQQLLRSPPVSGAVINVKNKKSGLLRRAPHFYSYNWRRSEFFALFGLLLVAIGNGAVSLYSSLSVLQVYLPRGGGLPPKDDDPNTVSSLIPKRFIFTHKHNILETKSPPLVYENVQRTMRMYKELWRQQKHGRHHRRSNRGGAVEEEEEDVVDSVSDAADDDDVDVWFLDDAACIEAIREVEPRLVPYFERERRGDFKADICRAAALYLRGGYYFDLDIQVIEPIVVPPWVNFVTALTLPAKSALFQALLFCQPQNPMVRLSMNFMMEYYQGRYPEAKSLVGPITLKRALDTVQPPTIHSLDDEQDDDENRIMVEQRNHSRSHNSNNNNNNNNNNTALILYESSMSAKNGTVMFPGIPFQHGIGSLCHYIVHDSKKRPYFYSRMVQFSYKCRHPSWVAIKSPPQNQRKIRIRIKG